MMGSEVRTALEINEMVNLYFKLLDKNESVNWDDFDKILQQILSFCMQNNTTMEGFVEKHKDVLTHFKRRAIRHEYPTLHYIIYLNFATVIQLEGETIDRLLRQGNDIIYGHLQWPDKLALLDVSNRANAPYKQ